MEIIHYKIEQQTECFSETKTKTKIECTLLYFFYGIEKKKRKII